jgi:DNA-binding transcriptional MerR regulator
MLKPSAQLRDEDFLGSAEELAQFVTAKLIALGFGAQHQSTERLVRFYAYQGLLSKADRAVDDRRKANFGPMQVRQLLLARLLSERGWDLERIKSLFNENDSLEKLGDLIDSLAMPTEAERLLFKTRLQPSGNKKLTVFDSRRDFVGEPNSFRSKPAMRAESDISYGASSKQVSSRAAHKLREISESESPAMALKLFIKKELMRDDLSDEAKALFVQLLAFNPTSTGDEPKRERWSRLRLNHWCEVHLHIDGKPLLSTQEINSLVEQFRKSLT